MDTTTTVGRSTGTHWPTGLAPEPYAEVAADPAALERLACAWAAGFGALDPEELSAEGRTEEEAVAEYAQEARDILAQ